MEGPATLWNEIRVTSDGISITLLSESHEGGAVVEDETWLTFAEMQEKSPQSPISLRPSSETRDKMREQARLANIGRIYEEEKNALPEVGDVVTDQNPPSWADPDRELTVTEVLPDTRCDEYVIQEHTFHPDDTVADANPSYNVDEPVVIAKYGGTGKDYAFPASRLA